jgi:type II secretory pathway pseudopilin PulG
MNMEKKRKKSDKKEDGYILLEVLIALLVISLTMTSILGGFSVLGKITGNSLIRTQNLINERNEFEKLQRLP